MYLRISNYGSSQEIRYEVTSCSVLIGALIGPSLVRALLHTWVPHGCGLDHIGPSSVSFGFVRMLDLVIGPVYSLGFVRHI